VVTTTTAAALPGSSRGAATGTSTGGPRGASPRAPGSSSPTAGASTAAAPREPGPSSTSTTAAAATTTLPPAANVTYDADAVASYGVGPQPANWNIHALTASAAYPTLAQILAQVWPSAFQAAPNGAAVLNSSLLSSAQQVSSSPQTLLYQINPRAVWSDGAPITYRDFQYNWRAQSGRSQFRDAGGQHFTPLDDAGYIDIASVSGTPADPYSVTVVFSKPYADWRSLFAYLMPAQVAEAVGFDHGFTDPVTDLVSGGPFVVSELQAGYSLELVRNARYWGNPANLSSVTYYFMGSTAEALDAVTAGELQVAALEVPPSDLQQLQAANGFSVQPVASATYEDLDFNEAAGPFRSAVLREAVMMSVDRGGMATSALGPYGLGAKPVENRLLLPGAPGYSANGTNFDQPAPSSALRLLAAAGYTVTGGHLEAPGGQRVEATLVFSGSDPVASELAGQVASGCAAIGLKVTVRGTLRGLGAAAGLPPGWEMAIEAREVPQFPSVIASRYASGGAANLDSYSDRAMDSLLTELGSAAPGQLSSLYDQVDALAWKDFVDLPLVAVPIVFAVERGLLNLEPGPYYANLAWDEQEWGFAS